MCTVLLILSSCTDVPTATPEPDPARSELELPDLGAEAPPDLELPVLLPGWQELPIEALLKAEVVSFPHAGQVGVCHTQMASRTRPLPFRVHRIEVELPKAAWEEAEGRTALLQYRRFSGSKGYVMRVARCRIPDSPLAVEALFQRFSSSDPSVTYSWSRAGGEPGAQDSSRGAWVIGALTASESFDFRGARGVSATSTATLEECPEGGDGSEDCPYMIDGVENDQCHPNQEYDQAFDECYCDNGSDEPDCWLDPEDEGSGDETCDPSFEECDGGGGGGGGGGGDDDSHLDTESCPNCTSFDGEELETLLTATEHICSEARSSVEAALPAGEYGSRTHSWPIRGWHHKGFHTGESDYHYSINESHPGWTGELYSGESISPDQMLIELAGTMAHEFFHHLYPNETEAQIDSRTHACVEGYIGE